MEDANVEEKESTPHSPAGTKMRTTQGFFSLRIKLLVILLWSGIIPLGACVFFFSRDMWEVGLGVAVLSMGIAVVLYELLLVSPLKRLVRWVQEHQATNFTQSPVLPVQSGDEIGMLGRELGKVVARFWEIEKRTKTLLGQKEDFLTVAEHQLKTPINRLSWAVEVLMDPHASEEKKAELFGQIRTQLKYMILVVNNFLDSAKIEEGKYGYVFREVDMRLLVKTLVEEFLPLALERNIELTLADSGSLPMVYADPDRISHALFNLLSNALEYTPAGGSVTVSLKTSEDGVRVSVEDTGIGIPEGEQNRLFTRFYRASNAQSMRPNGSGLGLYIVRNIMNTHGSDISYTSQEGVGSQFSFTVPYTKEKHAQMVNMLTQQKIE